MTEIILNRSYIYAFIRQIVSTGMAQEMGVDRKLKTSQYPGLVNDMTDTPFTQRCVAISREDEGRRVIIFLELFQSSHLITLKRMATGTRTFGAPNINCAFTHVYVRPSQMGSFRTAQPVAVKHKDKGSIAEGVPSPFVLHNFNQPLYFKPSKVVSDNFAAGEWLGQLNRSSLAPCQSLILSLL